MFLDQIYQLDSISHFIPKNELGFILCYMTNIVFIFRRNYTIVEVNFTIIGVTKEDFSKTFVCWVSSSYSPGNQQFDVKLKKTSQLDNVFLTIFRKGVPLFFLSSFICYLNLKCNKLHIKCSKNPHPDSVHKIWR